MQPRVAQEKPVKPTAALADFARRLSRLGAPAGDWDIEARRTVICNQLGIAGFLLTQPFFWPNVHEPFAATTIFAFWLVLGGVFWLNAVGRHRAARLLFIGGVANLFYLLGLIVPARWPETKTGFMFLQLSFACFPLILFSMKRDAWLVAGLVAYITAQIMLFPTLDVALEIVDPPMSYDKAVLQNHMATIVAILVLTLSFGFYQRVARRAEGEFRKLLDSTRLQNQQLAGQEQEVRQTAAELRSTNEYINQTLAEVERQKSLLQQQKQGILESIRYAQRIQCAILPPANLIRSLFPESFVFYRPRDIVSGDFYWLYAAADRVFVAVVDCTGHGVPGAFMSVMAYSLLNQIVSEMPDLTPDLVLGELDSRVQQTLRQQGNHDDTLDGMDLALCSILLGEPKMEFAGAGRPLYLLREGELLKFDGDRLPVGGAQFKYKAYHCETIAMQAGDRYYLFTDGITDQFGLVNGRKRKFTPVRLQEWIVSQAGVAMARQEKNLNRLITEWQGREEQLDDLTMFAFEWKG